MKSSSQQRPPVAAPHMGSHPHPPLMPYPMAPYAMGPYGPHYAMTGMPYGPPPHVAAPMPPLISSTQNSTNKPASGSDSKKKDDNAFAGEPNPPEDDQGGEDGKKPGGLDLLASLALPGKKKAGDNKNSNNSNSSKKGKKKKDGEAEEKEESSMPQLDPNNPNAAAIAIIQKDSKNKKKKTRMEEMNPKEKLFVDKVRECDVLCGRGGKSNHHPGNKRYRQVVSEMKRTYQGTGAKTAKTDLSRAIVEHVVGYGGRFIKRDEGSGQYFLLTKAQARRKTSQALRETKELKWTM